MSAKATTMTSVNRRGPIEAQRILQPIHRIASAPRSARNRRPARDRDQESEIGREDADREGFGRPGRRDTDDRERTGSDQSRREPAEQLGRAMPDRTNRQARTNRPNRRTRRRRRRDIGLQKRHRLSPTSDRDRRDPPRAP